MLALGYVLPTFFSDTLMIIEDGSNNCIVSFDFIVMLYIIEHIFLNSDRMKI